MHIRRGVAGLDEALKLAAGTKAPLHVVHINSTGTAADPRDAPDDYGRAKAWPGRHDGGLSVRGRHDGDSIRESGRVRRRRPRTRLALLEWPRTGERLTRETFQKYRKTGGPVVLHTNTEEMVAVAINSPLTMIASDAYWENGTGHPRTTGTYSKVLGRYVREAGSLTLMDAIRKMTLMPAQRLECASAGHAGPRGGCAWAPTRTSRSSTRRRLSIGRRIASPRAPPAGIRHVIVNGVPVVANGQPVEGVTPGLAVRAP